ncbi:MAG: phytanoyl-CoA dioxygenase family protein [Abditibacteriales bacterium]|nr:phytanoyl-CoA dioxygenase family protein [Abditibacteriales bacterium]MDW8367991.1 phytanoyl-CoA dioxygenase family protein [Abditibacteriales bacterium]
MLSQAQINFYNENGFLVVEDVFPMDVVEEARAVVEDFVEKSRTVTEHTDVYDLEPGHSPQAPRVRRLKNPVAIHPIFDRMARSDKLLDIVADLIGPDIRLHGSKLNMKAAAYGSPVEWHQDFAFYPHTNDDLLAVGIYLDDCTTENGCMLMIPGSHRWEILDHHQDGVFVGAVDVKRWGIDTSSAVPIVARAGGISLHHCRTLHGSATNTSPKPRRLFLLELAAADACPVSGVTDLAQFNAKILRGNPVSRYRVKDMDIRLPLPKPERQGSIYEIQTAFRPKVFATAQT